MRSERGVTLVEVLVAILVVSGGVLVTLGSFSEFSSAAKTAQHRAVLVSLAQREIEALRPIPYEELALTAAPPAQAAAEAPLAGPAASEAILVGGTVRPGGDAFQAAKYGGRIYRYVTRTVQQCPALSEKVATQLSSVLGQPIVSLVSAVGDLCPPGSQATKRITIVVVPLEGEDENGERVPGTPLHASTVITDPKTALPAAVNYAGLKVQQVAASVTGATGTTRQPESSQQAFHLSDTRCSVATRGAPSDHATRDTSAVGAACDATSASRPDLMVPTAVPGATTDLLPDFSTDITRPAAGGLVLMRDDRAGTCDAADALAYAPADAGRARSLHTWATPAASAAFQTPTTGGRGSVTLWASTATQQTGMARLCAVLRSAATGQILGKTDYTLPSWPTEPTELTLAFDLAHVTLSSGDRLLLTLRVPSDSEQDLRIAYDHPLHPSSVTVSAATGMELR